MKKGWTPKKIKTGFDKFKKEHGCLPTAHEIDKTTYLPSSRYIQKRFGGLKYLRSELGYSDTHFGKGASRSIITQTVGIQGRQLESDFKEELMELLGSDCIDVEKSFDGKKRVDFYITTPEGSFGIDIFHAQTMRTLQSSVNIKMKKYQYFTDTLYLTVANNKLRQKNLDIYVNRKKNPLPINVSLVTLSTLFKILKKKK